MRYQITRLFHYFRANLAAIACLVAFFSAAQASEAAEGPWARAPEVEIRLISAVQGVGALQNIPVGLQVRLSRDWKTYWRSPGDAGLPPVLDWLGSENVAKVDLAWPAPHRFTLFGLDTFGYEHEVVFPLLVTPIVQGQPVSLRGQASLLVCADLCIPHVLDMALDLPQAPAASDALNANLIDRYDSQVPDDGAVSGLSLASVGLDRQAGEHGALLVDATAREPFSTPDILIENESGYAFATPAIDMGSDGLSLTARFEVLDAPDTAAALEALPVTLTLIDGPRAMEAAVRVAQGAVDQGAVEQSGGAAQGVSMLVMIGIALLGGLILNLMPCVLPVLSLKLFSFASMGGADVGVVRRGFLATVAGILTCFCLLGLAIVAARSAGAAVGWGLQFQQPLFLVLMIAVLVLFAANLWGVFEVGLNRRLADGATIASEGHGTLRHFATGAFAALLATPCSAPFVGTAVAFALTRGPLEIMVIFLALGLGLAVPYLLVAAVPRLAGLMPKPGRWMLSLKRILGLALLATALWLTWVLTASTSLAAAFVVLVLAGLAAFALGHERLPRFVPGGVAMGALALAFAVPVLAEQAPRLAGSNNADAGGLAWGGFNEAAIAGMVAAGETVLVDVTADWCLTCKANKALVLEQGQIAKTLTDGSVRPLKADWTRPDAAIADYLARHGRYGIPFNIVYGPAAPDGIVLPELLTPQSVLDAFMEAGGDEARG